MYSACRTTYNYTASPTFAIWSNVHWRRTAVSHRYGYVVAFKQDSRTNSQLRPDDVQAKILNVKRNNVVCDSSTDMHISAHSRHLIHSFPPLSTQTCINYLTNVDYLVVKAQKCL